MKKKARGHVPWYQFYEKILRGRGIAVLLILLALLKLTTENVYSIETSCTIVSEETLIRESKFRVITIAGDDVEQNQVKGTVTDACSKHKK